MRLLHENSKNKNRTFCNIQESFCQVKLMSEIPKKKMFCSSCLKKPLFFLYDYKCTSPFYINIQIKKKKKEINILDKGLMKRKVTVTKL